MKERIRDSITIDHPKRSNNSQDVIRDVLRLREVAYTKRVYGPFLLYVGLGWEKHLDSDYQPTKETVPSCASCVTLRERIEQVDSIIKVITDRDMPEMEMRLVDYLSKQDEAAVITGSVVE